MASFSRPMRAAFTSRAQTRADAAPGQPVLAVDGSAGAVVHATLVDAQPGLELLPAGLDILSPSATHAGYAVLVRLLDLVVASILLFIGLPVMLILAVLVGLDSGGRVIFSQTRVGQFGRPFKFYKFRTMWVDAHHRFPDLYAYSYTEHEVRTMYFKRLDDPRVTRFGRLLRKTSLDELPNLFNVLRGDMSMVGPRPEIPEMLVYYRPHQLRKFSVKPGITGVAQVGGRGLLTFQETLAADLQHCERQSLWFDVLILLRTMKCVVLRIGAF